jgi:hypothetical protein
METTYSQQNLIDDGKRNLLLTFQGFVLDLQVNKGLLLDKNYLVFDWSKVPDYMRKIFDYNGGDEDYLIIGPKEDEAPWFVEQIGTHCFDTYKLNFCNVYIPNHS